MGIKYLLLTTIASTLVACSNKQQPTTDPIVKAIDYNSLRDTKSQNVVLSNPTKSHITLNPKHGEPGHRCDLAVGAPLNANVPKANHTTPPTTQVTTQTTAPVKAAPASSTTVNPPHGQPHHRCDIAVGAPLNSKPVQANISTQTVKAIPPKVATPKGMNPPHGQPNHRCDIAVGAPLNSKPATAPTPTPQPAATTASPPVTGND